MDAITNKATADLIIELRQLEAIDIDVVDQDLMFAISDELNRRARRGDRQAYVAINE